MHSSTVGENRHCGWDAAGWKVDSKPSKSKEDSPHGRAARFERIAVAATKQSLRAHGLQLGGFAALETYLEEGMQSHALAFVAVAGAPELLHDEVTRHKLSLLRCTPPCT